MPSHSHSQIVKYCHFGLEFFIKSKTGILGMCWYGYEGIKLLQYGYISQYSCIDRIHVFIFLQWTLKCEGQTRQMQDILQLNITLYCPKRKLYWVLITIKTQSIFFYIMFCSVGLLSVFHDLRMRFNNQQSFFRELHFVPLKYDCFKNGLKSVWSLSSNNLSLLLNIPFCKSLANESLISELYLSKISASLIFIILYICSLMNISYFMPASPLENESTLLSDYLFCLCRVLQLLWHSRYFKPWK